MGAFFLTGMTTSAIGVGFMYCGTLWQRGAEGAKLVLGTGLGMTVAGFIAAYVGGLFPETPTASAMQLAWAMIRQ